jgi:hypothetical protein
LMNATAGAVGPEGQAAVGVQLAARLDCARTVARLRLSVLVAMRPNMFAVN